MIPADIELLAQAAETEATVTIVTANSGRTMTGTIHRDPASPDYVLVPLGSEGGSHLLDPADIQEVIFE